MNTFDVLETSPEGSSTSPSEETQAVAVIQTPIWQQPESSPGEYQQIVKKLFPTFSEEATWKLQMMVSFSSLKLFDLTLDKAKETMAVSNSKLANDPVPTKARKITAQTRCPTRIVFGEFLIETWYSSPYPEAYASLDLLHLCQFCFGYQQKSIDTLIRHVNQCEFRLPPGKKIYCKDDLSIFEVDGRERPEYCQNLCLMSKLFLDSKILYYDVQPFLFYILTRKIENVETDCQVMIGYFSKEKGNKQKYNVSCILVLPPEQEKGFGRFLIDFSYLLSRMEKQYGTPERPLSKLGKVSYMKYWKSSILEFFRKIGEGTPEINFSFPAIREHTGICDEDIKTTLESLKFITKPKKGQSFSWKINWAVVQREEVSTKRPVLDVEALNWEPPKCEPIARKSTARCIHNSYYTKGDSAKDGSKRRKMEVKIP